jgi:hypothetical protein
MKAIRLLYVLPVVLLFFVSCSPSRRLAGEYVSASSLQTGIYLIPAGYLEKSNLKKYPSAEMDGLTRVQRDSIRLVRSLFLQAVSDSVFLERFVNSYMDELRSLGLRVCLVWPDSLSCPPKNESFMVRMEQLELREYFIRMTDEQYIINALYQKDIDLQAISLHSWFTVHRLNQQPSNRFLYASNYISDDIVESGFGREENTGKIVHFKKTEFLDLKAIYNMAEALGRKYASYTYDYLLNEYVFRNRKGADPGNYYHYNRFKNRIESAGDNRFRPE